MAEIPSISSWGVKNVVSFVFRLCWKNREPSPLPTMIEPSAETSMGEEGKSLPGAPGTGGRARKVWPVGSVHVVAKFLLNPMSRRVARVRPTMVEPSAEIAVTSESPMKSSWVRGWGKPRPEKEDWAWSGEVRIVRVRRRKAIGIEIARWMSLRGIMGGLQSLVWWGVNFFRSVFYASSPVWILLDWRGWRLEFFGGEI